MYLPDRGGKELVMEIARFWESRSVLRDEDKGYEILGITVTDKLTNFKSMLKSYLFTQAYGIP